MERCLLMIIQRVYSKFKREIKYCSNFTWKKIAKFTINLSLLDFKLLAQKFRRQMEEEKKKKKNKIILKLFLNKKWKQKQKENNHKVINRKNYPKKWINKKKM